MLEFDHARIATKNRELKENVRPFYQRALEYISKKQLDIPQGYKTAKELIEMCEDLLHKQVTFAAKYLTNVLEDREKKQMNNISNLKKLFEDRTDELENKLQVNNSLLALQDLSRLNHFESSVARFHKHPILKGFKTPIFKPNMMVHEAYPHFLGEINYSAPQNCSEQLNIPTINFEKSQNQFLRIANVLDIFQRSPPSHGLFDLTCVKPQRILTSGRDKRLHLLDSSIQDGNHLLQTYKVSCESPYITMSTSGSVFYSDKRDKTVKQIKHLDTNEINTVLYFPEWEPRGLVFNPSNHLLICLVSTNRSIVAHYNEDMKLVQEIEYKDTNGTKLFEEPTFICSSAFCHVCVADHALHEVVVVDLTGVFQFSYRGQREQFRPHCLATDHLSNVLISDNVNQEIHVLDKYGQFLTLLTTGEKVSNPGAIAIDEEGKLLIGESLSGKINVVKYLE